MLQETTKEMMENAKEKTGELNKTRHKFYQRKTKYNTKEKTIELQKKARWTER